MQSGGRTPKLDSELGLKESDQTPHVQSRLRQRADSGTDILGLVARIGGIGNDKGIAFYAVRQLEQLGLVDSSSAISVVGGNLTFQGWQEFDRLKHEIVESRRAFMAMPFNISKLDHIYESCFRPAVKATGFQLYRIDEKPPAGSIDNRLRVEIRRSRFLIADLTEDNAGAYWEAGFAEGLGRPVIYTCENGHRTHFDTRQQQTIFWTEDKLDEAAQRLKNTIRATLPSEAELDDNE
jgi:hypothetical protein